ncbi:MAG TPA: glycosyltransferase family 1 protein, partial [Bacteroidia bacterium]
MDKHLHIISFDVPYPANYGGVIDVFYKLKNLHKAGVKITLHCFEYGRGEQKELEKYCDKVYYYKRDTSFINQLSSVPFIIKSRNAELLIKNLLIDEHPILFEGLHTCYFLNDKRLANRFKIYRESNIEHDYYAHLAKSERNLVKKLYFNLEANKLRSFQKQLEYADVMLVVSTADRDYLQQQFPNKKVVYLPSFHAFDEVKIKEGKGDYVLYNGNLQVAENIKAVEYLIKNVFSKIKHPVIIAGLNPSAEIYNWVKSFTNIQIKANPSEAEMQALIEDAQIHCLFTHQATGLKLKLLNVLFSGRFCICNENMLVGTGLQNACLVKNTSCEMIEAINNTFQKEFTTDLINLRKQALQAFDNSGKTQQLISY